MKIQKQTQVELAQRKHQRPVDLVQYDTGVQLVVTVTDFEVPTGTTATLYVQKPSGKFVYQETGITISGNVITVNLENQALTEHGETGYQLRLVNGSDRITTFAGVLNVQKSLADAGAVESSTVIAAFEAKTAEQIAEIQAEADAQIERIQNQFNTFATKTDAANAVKGNLSGAVVVADDVSPMEHELSVIVRGVNMIPFPYYNPSGVINGITYTINNDGSVTAKGTATSNAAFYLTKGLSGIKGAVYLSGCPAGGSITGSSGGGYSLRMNKFVDGVESTGGVDVGNGNKIILNGEEIRVYIVVLSGKTVDCTFRPMLNYGETAASYEPYVDPTTVKVTRCGKAIFSKSKQVVSGANTSWTSAFVEKVKVPPGDYVLSCRFKQSGTDKATVVLSARNYNDHSIIFNSARSSETEGNLSTRFTVAPGSGGFQIYLYSNSSGTALTTECSFENICVEAGTESTGYQAYTGEEFTPNADGSVDGVTSLSPNMTLLTDTEGVIVECEYNVDLKTYIDNKFSALATAILNNA